MRKIILKEPDTNRTKNTKRWLGWLSVCMLLLMGQVGFAQVNAYSFTQTVGVYQSIVSDGVLVAGSEATTATTNDTSGWSVSLPFTFNFNAVDYTSIYVNSNGGATFGTTTSNGSSLISSSTGYSGAISVMDRDLWGVFITSGVTASGSNVITNVGSFRGIAIGKDLASGTGIPAGTTITAFDEGASTITMSKNATSSSSSAVVRYGTGKVFTKIEGATPNRVFTIQWEGYNDWSTAISGSNYMSFQLKLTESANTVQIVFGEHYNLNTTTRTSQLGLRGATNADYNNRTASVTTPWNSTTSGISNSATVSRNNVNFPASGLTFTWTPPSCLAPSTISATNITHNSADLTWAGSGSNFDIEWGTQGFPKGTGTTVSGVSPYTLGGLSSSTSYSYYIRQNCGGGDYSTWAGPYSFKTSCVAGTIPFFEGFETGYTHNTALGNCWSQQDIAGTQNWMVNSTNTDYNRTPKSGSFNTTLQYGNTDWIFYPIDLTGGVAYELKFYARQDVTSGASIEAAYGSANTAAAMVNSIIATSAVTNGDYQEFSGFFTPATNGIYYFGIKATLNFSPWHISLDDISVVEAPNCLQPLDLASTNPTTNSIDFSWNGAGGASGNYEIRWGAVSFDINAATSIPVSGQSYTLSATGGNYEYVVREICSINDSSTWSARKSFRIPNVGEDCAAPIVIGALPYTTTDDTANYTDNPNIEGSPGSSGCGTTGYYLNGNDVVYAYTAAFDGVIQVKMTPSGTWTGIFAYADCADIGTACIGGAYNSGSAVNMFELNVTNGETYYFVISTNAAPQTVGYTLDISQVLCPKPTGVAHTDVTHNSANVSWDVSGNYEINWGPSSPTFTAGGGVNTNTVNATTEFAFSGLNGNTSYRYFVRQNCGGASGNSEWVGPYTFTTLVAPASIPWLEPFTGTAFPANWSNTSTWTVGASTTIVPGAEGSYLYKEIWGTTGTNGAMFSTLRMGLVSAGDILNFNYGLKKYTASYTASGTISIEVSTDNGVTYSPFQTITHSDDVAWTSSEQFDLSAYAGENIRIRITAKKTGSTDDYYLGFDNFYVGQPITCEAPSALTATNITANTADLGWTSEGSTFDISWGTGTFDAEDGTIVSLANGGTLSGLAPQTTYQYYVRQNCGAVDGTSIWVGPFSFTTECLPPSITETTGDTICGEGEANLTVVTDGDVVSWYTSATGGVKIGSGATFTTPLNTETTSYYAEAGFIVPNVTAQVGTATTTSSSSGSSPYYHGWGGVKTQYIYKVEELIAAGLNSGPITSIAFDVTSTGSNLADFTVHIGTTTQELATATHVSGLTLVYSNANQATTVGLNTYSLTGTFVWDGISNIVVQTSFSNVNTGGTSASTRYHAPGSNLTTYTYADNRTAQQILDTMTGAVSNGSGTSGGTSTSTSRANIYINGNGVCASERTEVIATVTAAPDFELSQTTLEICEGDTSDAVTITTGASDYDTYEWTPSLGVSGDATTGWSFDPTESTTYVLTASQSGGAECMTTFEVQVNVNPLPTAITVVASETEVAVGDIVVLSVTGNINNGTAILGDGTTAPGSTSYPNPFSKFYGGTKHQMLYTAAELSAQGMMAGSEISAVTFDFADRKSVV